MERVSDLEHERKRQKIERKLKEVLVSDKRITAQQIEYFRNSGEFKETLDELLDFWVTHFPTSEVEVYLDKNLKVRMREVKSEAAEEARQESFLRENLRDQLIRLFTKEGTLDEAKDVRNRTIRSEEFIEACLRVIKEKQIRNPILEIRAEDGTVIINEAAEETGESEKWYKGNFARAGGKIQKWFEQRKEADKEGKEANEERKEAAKSNEKAKDDGEVEPDRQAEAKNQILSESLGSKRVTRPKVPEAKTPNPMSPSEIIKRTKYALMLSTAGLGILYGGELILLKESQEDIPVEVMPKSEGQETATTKQVELGEKTSNEAPSHISFEATVYAENGRIYIKATVNKIPIPEENIKVENISQVGPKTFMGQIVFSSSHNEKSVPYRATVKAGPTTKTVTITAVKS